MSSALLYVPISRKYRAWIGGLKLMSCQLRHRFVSSVRSTIVVHVVLSLDASILYR